MDTFFKGFSKFLQKGGAKKRSPKRRSTKRKSSTRRSSPKRTTTVVKRVVYRDPYELEKERYIRDLNNRLIYKNILRNTRREQKPETPKPQRRQVATETPKPQKHQMAVGDDEQFTGKI